MVKLKINFIGCGRVGQTLAKLFSMIPHIEIGGVVTTSLTTAEKAIQFIGAGIAFNDFQKLPQADIYFITTSDQHVATVAQQLAHLSLSPSTIVAHCSGALNSSILAPLGCAIASIHPIKSFACPHISVATFSGTYCAIEGIEYAVQQLSALFTLLGAKVTRIKKESKNVYHAASVLANNYLVTLHAHATQSYLTAGIDPGIATLLVTQLMEGALDNLKSMPHHIALTGPIQRGDIDTIKKNINGLSQAQVPKETLQLYAQLGLGTLALTNHSTETISELNILFKSLIEPVSNS